MLLYFSEYCLYQLNNKYTKIAVNSTIQFFETCNQKKYIIKVWSFLTHPPQYDDPVKLNGNHLLMANIWLNQNTDICFIENAQYEQNLKNHPFL